MPGRDNFVCPGTLLNNLEEARTKLANEPVSLRWAVGVLLTSLIEYIRYNELK